MKLAIVRVLAHEVLVDELLRCCSKDSLDGRQYSVIYVTLNSKVLELYFIVILLRISFIFALEEKLEGLWCLRLLHRFLIQRQFLLRKIEEVLALQLVNLILGVSNHESMRRFLVAEQSIFLIWGVWIGWETGCWAYYLASELLISVFLFVKAVKCGLPLALLRLVLIHGVYRMRHSEDSCQLLVMWISNHLLRLFSSGHLNIFLFLSLLLLLSLNLIRVTQIWLVGPLEWCVSQVLNISFVYQCFVASFELFRIDEVLSYGFDVETSHVAVLILEVKTVLVFGEDELLDILVGQCLIIKATMIQGVFFIEYRCLNNIWPL